MVVGGCDERRVAAAGDNIDRGGSNVCALLYSTPTLLGKVSKIWEVRRKSVESLQEVCRNYFLNRYPTRSIHQERSGNLGLS